MATLLNWMMGISKFESLPSNIKATEQWRRYQNTITTATNQLDAAKERLKEAKQAAEDWAVEQLDEIAETRAYVNFQEEGRRNAEAARRQQGGRRHRRRTRKRRHKRRKKPRRGGRRRR